MRSTVFEMDFDGWDGRPELQEAIRSVRIGLGFISDEI